MDNMLFTKNRIAAPMCILCEPDHHIFFYDYLFGGMQFLITWSAYLIFLISMHVNQCMHYI